jgi:hypothetical protein
LSVAGRAAAGEERLEQRAALVGEHAAEGIKRVVERRRVRQVEDAAGRPLARVPGAEHEPRDARVHQRRGTHRAWLERHVQRCATEAVTGERLAGGAQREDLGVRGRVAGLDRLVPALADDPANDARRM